MYVPSEIVLFGQTIKIIYKRDLIDKYQAFGFWDYNKNKIYIQQSTRKHKLTEEQIHQTLTHECTHAFLDLLGHSILSQDEVFVSSLSNLIHQYIKQIH